QGAGGAAVAGPGVLGPAQLADGVAVLEVVFVLDVPDLLAVGHAGLVQHEVLRGLARRVAHVQPGEEHVPHVRGRGRPGIAVRVEAERHEILEVGGLAGAGVAAGRAPRVLQGPGPLPGRGPGLFVALGVEGAEVFARVRVPEALVFDRHLRVVRDADAAFGVGVDPVDDEVLLAL
ncbi:MAG: hypothetical protein ACK559_42295, partial [bacterium]